MLNLSVPTQVQPLLSLFISMVFILLQAALESLTVQNVGCSINACNALSQILLRCGALKQLHLFNNMSDNAGAELIAQVGGGGGAS